jgi:hypothetical protein
MKQTQLQRTSQSLIGSMLLGRYRVVSELAKGGMGVVYLARSEGAVGFVKPVVIKVLLPEFAQDERVVGMFVREAQILSQLRHPSLVDVLEFAEHDGAYLLVLEYVRAHHLGQWLRFLNLKNRSVAPEIVIQIVIDVLEALHHAHNQMHPDGSPMQIVHRDVSPSNILLDETGRARLLDFGVARMRGGSHGYRTQVKSFMGKLPYTAPEVFAGRDASPKTDLYACAVVLHEALLGHNVFRSEMQSITLAKVMSHIPELVEPVRRGVPPGLDAVLSKALRKTPTDRHEDAQAFAEALRKLQREPESDLRARLARVLAEDFGTELARMLNLESLAERDEAWRSFADQPAEPRRATGAMPAANATLPGGVIPASATLPGVVSGAALPDGVAGASVLVKDSQPLAAPTPIGSTAVSGPLRRGTRRSFSQEQAAAGDRADAVGALVAGLAEPHNDNALGQESRSPERQDSPADAKLEAEASADASDGVITQARPLPAAKALAIARASSRAVPAPTDEDWLSSSETLRPSTGARTDGRFENERLATSPARADWPTSSPTDVDMLAPAAPGDAGEAAARSRADDRHRQPPMAANDARDFRQPTAARGGSATATSATGAPRGMLIGMWLVGGLAVIAIGLGLLRLPVAAPAAVSPVRVVAHLTANTPTPVQPTAAVAIGDSPAGESTSGREAARPNRAPRARPNPNPSPKSPSPQGFTQAMRKQQPKLQACFAQHSLSLEGQPVTQLAFDVDESGKPLRVELMPRALLKTSLGQCLLGVARATVFPAQARPVSFTIPITARRAATTGG